MACRLVGSKPLFIGHLETIFSDILIEMYVF